MTREELAALLTDGRAALLARAALVSGDPYEVWTADGSGSSAEQFAAIYHRRLKTARSWGTPTVDLAEAVNRLRAAGIDRNHLGRVDAAGGWTYMVFLAEALDQCIACTGVQRSVRPSDRR